MVKIEKKLSWHIQQSFKFQLMFSNHFAFKSGESHVDCDLLLLLLWSNCSPNSNYILNPQPCIQKAQHRKLVGFNHAKKFPIKFGWRSRHTESVVALRQRLGEFFYYGNIFGGLFKKDRSLFRVVLNYSCYTVVCDWESSRLHLCSKMRSLWQSITCIENPSSRLNWICVC